jgi:hypothetical protein
MLLALGLGNCRGAGLSHGSATLFLTELKNSKGGRRSQFPQRLSGEGGKFLLFFPIGP